MNTFFYSIAFSLAFQQSADSSGNPKTAPVRLRRTVIELKKKSARKNVRDHSRGPFANKKTFRRGRVAAQMKRVTVVDVFFLRARFSCARTSLLCSIGSEHNTTCVVTRRGRLMKSRRPYTESASVRFDLARVQKTVVTITIINRLGRDIIVVFFNSF